jgi:hypothetical protein
VHDEDTLAEPPTMLDDEDEPPYALLATLLRSRLAALPEARKPVGARQHVHPGPDAATTLLEDLAKIISAAGGPGGRLGGLGSARLARFAFLVELEFVRESPNSIWDGGCRRSRRTAMRHAADSVTARRCRGGR